MVPQVAAGSIFAGDFKVIRMIGSGGMGTVYEVEQLSTRKHRALKLLGSRLGIGDKGHQRFVREATVGAQIESAHVVEVIAAGIDAPSSTPWLAMELLEGADLKRVVESHGGLGPVALREICQQLCHGLGAAHRAGVVHRDLKPENIYIAHSRRAGAKFTVKILDFGIAKLTYELTATTDTGTVGSPLWMAPEQLNAQALTPRTDVWALGLLVFWAMTGKAYWKVAHQPRTTVQSLFAEQLFSELEPASVRARSVGGRDVVEGFDAWFTACVQRDPSQRFADAQAAGVALDSILRPIAEASPESEPPLLAAVEEEVPTKISGAIPLSPPASEPRLFASGIQGTTGNLRLIEDDDTFAATTFTDRPGHEAPVTDPAVRRAAMFPRSEAPGASAGEASENRTGFGRGHVAIAAAVPAMLAGAVAMWFATSEPDPDPDPTTQPMVVSDPRPHDDPRSLESRGEDPVPRDLHGGGEPPRDGPGLREPPERKTRIRSPPDHLGDAPLDVPALGSGPHPLVTFQGWTVDGDAFALRLQYSNGDGPPLDVVELHDGVTGWVQERFVVGPDHPDELTWPPPLATLIEDAADVDAWTRRRVDLLLRHPDPQRAPEQGWELRLSHRPVPAATKVQVVPKRRGFEFRWYGFDGASPEVAELVLELDHVTEPRRDRLLTFPVGLTSADAIRASAGKAEMATISGAVLPHWAPDRTRCVLVIESQLERVDHPAHSTHWFLRAPGPQIELVDAGVGDGALREAAVRLHGAGLTPARFARSGETPDGPLILHAPGEEGLAEQIRLALGHDFTLRPQAQLTPLAARVLLVR